jgi:heptaprenyl diphosphate synthase
MGDERMTKSRQSPDKTESSSEPASSASRLRSAKAPRRANSAVRVATYGALAALALIFGYLEALFPLPIPVPGIKLGLGNIVVLYALVCLGERAGFGIMLVKVVASALLFGNPLVFAYSLGGALVSFALMAVALRWQRLSLVGVSMIGGVGHMLGQLIVVSVVLTWRIALFYLPILVVAGLVTGAIVGILCRLTIRATRNSAVIRDQRKRLAAAAASSVEGYADGAGAAIGAGEANGAGAATSSSGAAGARAADTPGGGESGAASESKDSGGSELPLQDVLNADYDFADEAGSTGSEKGMQDERHE